MTPVSELRSAVSRENGAKSRGPVTPEGKARSSRNAKKHGLSSRRILLDGESDEDLHALRVHWMRQLQPHTPAERELVEEVVASAWRLRRCQEAEAELLNAELESCAHPTAGAALKSLADNSKVLQLLLRYMTSAERSFDHALERFHEVVKQRCSAQSGDRFDDAISEEEYENKWGIHSGETIVSYWGRSADVLPNEPDDVGILTPMLEP